MSERISVPTYAALLNMGKVTPPNGQAYVQVEDHFFRDCMRSLLAQIPVDEAWYLAAHPDVRQAIEAGTVSDARDHFIRFGYYEHRFPFRIQVDEAWYLSAYPDVRRAIDRGQFASAQDHFSRFGYREGRAPYAHFSLGAGRRAPAEAA